MEPKTKKILIITVSLLVIGGTVGYILWKRKKDSKPKNPVLDPNTGGGNTPAYTPAYTPTVETKVVTPGTVTVVPGSPGLNKDQIMAFQTYANTKGATLKIDGSWGPLTQAQWDKFGAEWKKMVGAGAIAGVTSVTESPGYKVARQIAQMGFQPTFEYNKLWYDTKTGSKVATPITGDNAIGKIAYPKETYTNVRDEPRSASGTFDNTFIGKVNSPNAIGKIKNLTYGVDKYRWYEVDILTPLIKSDELGMGNPYAKTGWVREDTLTIK